jgi:hypothetical protein
LQQIGERIPGAVAKFAAANKISLQELAEQFKKGEVTIAKFVRFTEQQGEDYAEVAEALASGPEKAGVRLQIALDEASEAYGGFFLKTGAGFQDYLTNLVNFVIDNEEQFKILLAKVIVFAEDVYDTFAGLGKAIWQIFGGLFQGIGKLIVEFSRATAAMFRQQDLEGLVREKGLKPNDIRRQAFNQIQQESGDLLAPYKDRGALNNLYNKLLAEAAGVDKTNEENRLAEVLKGFGKYTPPAFAKPGQTAPPAAGDLDGDGDGNGSGKTKTKRPARADFSMLEGAFARDAALRVQKENAAIEIEIVKAEFEGNKAQVFALKQKQERLKVNQIIVNLEELTRQRAIQIVNAQSKGLDVAKVQSKQLKDQNNLQLARLEKETLLTVQEVERLKFNKEITAELDKQRKSFEDQFLDRQRELGLISSGDYNQVLLGRERDRLADPKLGLTSEQQDRGLDQYRQTIDPTLTEGLSQNIRSLKTELEDLVNPINQITGAANAIGSAFSQSFTNAISGSKSAKEALADFFKSVGSYFLDMAAQIIAKMITISILNAITGLLPGGGGGGIGFNPSAPSITGNSIGDFGGGTPFFAEGGYVTGPTSAVVGEGGEPEYIIPESKMRESMSRYSRGSRGSSVIPAEGGGGSAGAEGGVAVAAPIDVRYTVERINSVDYVTADQFQAGMREAASSGARQGEQRALSTLRQNTTQRRRIGI